MAKGLSSEGIPHTPQTEVQRVLGVPRQGGVTAEQRGAVRAAVRGAIRVGNR